MTPRGLPLLLVAALLAPGLLAACGADDEEVLTVLTAASLTDVFDDVARSFEAAHPGVDVRLVTGASTTLAEQAADGAPGDVLATADAASMDLAGSAVGGPPVTFAANGLVLVVPAGNPAGVTGLDDLAGARWVRCADAVPCGRLALAALGDLDGPGGTRPAPEAASLEVDVRAVLAKVVSGEADAGLVYASDAVAAGSAVEVVAVPGAAPGGRPTHVTRYQAAPLVQAGDADLAGEFVRHLRSREARDALRDAGFRVGSTG